MDVNQNLMELMARRAAATQGPPVLAPAVPGAAASAPTAAAPMMLPDFGPEDHEDDLLLPQDSRGAVGVLPSSIARVIARVPKFYTGQDRLQAFVTGVTELPEQDRERIREVVETFVTRMIDVNASDMDTGGTACLGYVWYRVVGDKKPYKEVGRFSEDELNVILLNQLNDTQMHDLMEKRSIDFSYQLPFLGIDGSRRRFRCTCYFDYDNLALNMRAITDQVRPMKGIEFHPAIERGLMFRHERDGLTLITGVTGSGKSSTLDAIIDANNADVHAHIIIVGKPIEYMHVSKKSIVRHREVGKDVTSFKDGIVQSLRQDPDIVVIGEMRDPETISAAIEITDSGHKVFSTLHTSSAVESIDRIVGEYAHEAQERIRNRLADVLRCVVSQKLAPKIGGGRVLCKEVLWMTSPARAAIKNNNAGEIYQMMWEGNAIGMITMEQDLARLARLRLITPETAFSYANNKRRLQQLLG